MYAALACATLKTTTMTHKMKFLFGAFVFATLVSPAVAQKRSPQLPEAQQTSPRSERAVELQEQHAAGHPGRGHAKGKKTHSHRPTSDAGRPDSYEPTRPDRAERPTAPTQREQLPVVAPREVTPEERKAATAKKHAKMSGSN
jgi:hypothetical protein